MPKYQVTVDYPNMMKPDDLPEEDKHLGYIEVPGLGLFPNGATTTIEDDEGGPTAEDKVKSWQDRNEQEWPEDGLQVNHSEAEKMREEAASAEADYAGPGVVPAVPIPTKAAAPTKKAATPVEPAGGADTTGGNS